MTHAGIPLRQRDGTSDVLVRAVNLRKSFGEVRAVDDISFSVAPGESFGVLGPNGAGKTTTIRMIYGFSPVSGGDLTVFGTPVVGDLRGVKKRIGVCQQGNSLDPDLTVRQNLLIYARYFDIPRREARERADELLRFISLDHRRDASVAELSGGMARRLMIARALINRPELLILDEPTTGLDPQSRHQVWERLESLKARGLTILLTTHYMEEAQRLCDRIVIMDRGRILVEGRPLDLIASHVGRNIIEVSEPTDALRGFIVAEGLQHDDLGHRIIIYAQDGERIFSILSTRYCASGCYLRMATLEDVFLKLTGRDLRE